MRSLPPGAPGIINMKSGLTTAQQLASAKKQSSALSRQVAQAQAAQVAAEVERDKAERAVRDMDRQFAATRAKLSRAEALLRSHGLDVPDAEGVVAAPADGGHR